MGISLRQLGTVGAVYGPPGAGRAPGVVVLHGAEGPMAGWAHRFAAILAAEGFRALPLSWGEGDFFGVGAAAEVPLEPVLAAGAALAAEPDVGRVGLFGWSMGAQMALLTAALRPAEVYACVAAHAPPDRITRAFDPAAFRRGEPMLPAGPEHPSPFALAGSAIVPGTPIPVERIAVPVFLSSGTLDPVFPHAMTLALAERLAAAGRPAEVLAAEGQGHGFDFDAEPVLWARLGAFLRRHLSGG